MPPRYPAVDPAALPIIDAAIQADLCAAFPPAGRTALLDQLRDSLEADRLILANPAAPRAEHIDAAHRLASAAGMYGFPRLAGAARALETAWRQGNEPAPTLPALLREELEAMPPRLAALAAQ